MKMAMKDTELHIERDCFTYKITCTHRLTKDKLFELRKLGFLGYGQEMQILSKCDGTEEIVPEETKPSPRGPNYFPHTFYVYYVLDIVDSSD